MYGACCSLPPVHISFLVCALMMFHLCLRHMRFKARERTNPVRYFCRSPHLHNLPSASSAAHPGIDCVTGYSRPRQEAENLSSEPLPVPLFQFQEEKPAVKTISAFALDLSDSNEVDASC